MKNTLMSPILRCLVVKAGSDRTATEQTTKTAKHKGGVGALNLDLQLQPSPSHKHRRALMAPVLAPARPLLCGHRDPSSEIESEGKMKCGRTTSLPASAGFARGFNSDRLPASLPPDWHSMHCSEPSAQWPLTVATSKLQEVRHCLGDLECLLELDD